MPTYSNRGEGLSTRTDDELCFRVISPVRCLRIVLCVFIVLYCRHYTIYFGVFSVQRLVALPFISRPRQPTAFTRDRGRFGGLRHVCHELLISWRVCPFRLLPVCVSIFLGLFGNTPFKRKGKLRHPSLASKGEGIYAPEFSTALFVGHLFILGPSRRFRFHADCLATKSPPLF